MSTKALDYGTICALVCDEVCEALGEAEAYDADDAPGTDVVLMGGEPLEHVWCYDGFAVACLEDGRHVKIPYEIDGYDVTVSEPEDWTLVEADWQDVAEYDAEEDEPGAVKALGDDRVGGYAVRFGTEAEPDLSPMRDFFTKGTDFWIDAWQTRPMLYHHAQDESTADAPVVGVWTKARVDDVGVWLEGQLQSAHRYHAAIKELIRRGMLRLSSDSAPHLVVREAKSGGVHEIKRWPLLAASLTPSPAEPRLLPISALKTAFDAAGILPPAELIDSPEASDPTSARGGPPAKALPDPDAVAIELELIAIARLAEGA